jgi:hypothetical protein
VTGHVTVVAVAHLRIDNDVVIGLRVEMHGSDFGLTRGSVGAATFSGDTCSSPTPGKAGSRFVPAVDDQLCANGTRERESIGCGDTTSNYRDALPLAQTLQFARMGRRFRSYAYMGTCASTGLAGGRDRPDRPAGVTCGYGPDRGEPAAERNQDGGDHQAGYTRAARSSTRMSGPAMTPAPSRRPASDQEL